MIELFLRNYAYQPGPPRPPEPFNGIGGPPAGVNQGHGMSKNRRDKTKQNRRAKRKMANKSKRNNRR
jgi:hypothetical protein